MKKIYCEKYIDRVNKIKIMAAEDVRSRASPAPSANLDDTSSNPTRRHSHFKEYKFFRSFSAKVENWPMRKAEALWRKMRERKIAGI